MLILSFLPRLLGNDLKKDLQTSKLFLQWSYAVYFVFYYDSAYIYVFISLEKVSQSNDLPTSGTRLFYVLSLVIDVFQKCRPVTAL